VTRGPSAFGAAALPRLPTPPNVATASAAAKSEVVARHHWTYVDVPPDRATSSPMATTRAGDQLASAGDGKSAPPPPGNARGAAHDIVHSWGEYPVAEPPSDDSLAGARLMRADGIPHNYVPPKLGPDIPRIYRATWTAAEQERRENEGEAFHHDPAEPTTVPVAGQPPRSVPARLNADVAHARAPSAVAPQVPPRSAISRADQQGRAMCDAAFARNMDEIRDLLKEGADVNAAEPLIGSTALHIAAKWGHWQMVKLLLENGADPNKSDKQNMTPDMYAEARADGTACMILQNAMKAPAARSPQPARDQAAARGR
jgi:Ankyrin repeat